MADYSRDYSVSHGGDGSCSVAFRCFDASNAITLYGCEQGSERAEELLLEVRRRCLRFNRIWSFANSESDIARVNAPAYAVEVLPETAALLRHMLRLHADEPAFDFTIGAVSYLWKRARFSHEVPGDGALSEARAHVGAEKIRLEGRMLYKEDPLLQVDIGAAAKGYIANDLAAYLRSEGVACADVDLGGNLYLVGAHPEGRPWHLEVEVPESLPVEDRGVLAFEAADTSVVTSASFERFFEAGGKRYQHIIDPTTGRPSESDIVSATVVSADSVYADMLSTAVLLAGSTGFEALVGRHPHAGIIAVVRDGSVLRCGL